MSGKRYATHSGSWYSDSKSVLSNQLQTWLDKVPSATEESISIPVNGATAIIVPHAGYSYSGETAAHAFKCVDITKFDKIFILGPSHHSYFKECRLSPFKHYSTPLGDIKIDLEINKELADSKHFSYLDGTVDEEEHSLEMQLPYLYKIFEDRIDEVALIPIMVGSINSSLEKKYGELLSPYFKESRNLFVISSDFCHWGSRFSYTFYSSSKTPSSDPDDFDTCTNRPFKLYEAIENLDREGMNIIEAIDFDQFKQYLQTTGNTICGRHPISILLAILEHTFPKISRNPISDQGITDGQYSGSVPILKFIYYAQSSQITSKRDSSVSYAAGYVFNPITLNK
ncbi:UPF0103-domain-containing protein [Neoconidiobolus thromboides FSU 785]|nr:UPF0103-domain-containing protein [Neoconidiobolus thromboides FSU 785]